MKKILKPVVSVLFALGFIAQPSFAVQQNSDVSKLTKQVNKLEDEVAYLKNQLGAAPSIRHFGKRVRHEEPIIEPLHPNHPLHPQNSPNLPTVVGAIVPYNVKGAPNLPPETAGPHHAVLDPHKLPQISGPSTTPSFWPVDPDVPGRSLVSIGPYIGVPLEFSGSSLIINSPSINEDVTLLTMRKKINDRYKVLRIPENEEHSHLILSGMLEGQVAYLHQGHGPATSDIDLTTAELDGYVLGPSHWTTGLVTFGFDNSGASFIGNSRISNSRVFVNKAFITIGDFQKSLFYATIGQLYIPFGVYSTNLVTPPMTKTLGRTKARAVVLGSYPQCDNSLFGAVYFFRGDAYSENNGCGGLNCKINNGGANLGLKFKRGDFSGKMSVGWIGDIADSVGMQAAAFNNEIPAPIPPFLSNEQLVHAVPAYNFNFLLNFGDHWNLLGEWVGASTAFAPIDIEINNHGAKPHTERAELSYSFDWCTKPSSVAIAYGHSGDTLFLGLPRHRYSVVFNTSIWRNTLESIEFRHDVKFPSSYTSTGQGFTPINSTTTPNLLGRPDNAVTLQMDMFF